MTATALHEAPVLVVGAGPVGLTMACELRRHGVACRIIDRNDGPTPLNESRALGIQ
ncbi:MAG: FAD-dependent monooxygenase, partial [Planctomycetaceae bacterium]|nr:FAD-dependent monooxygenase [Planctomycetaceae bacterium]